MKDTIYVFGNWKMNMTEKETSAYFERFLSSCCVAKRYPDCGCSVVVFPPYTSIPETRNCLERHYQRQRAQCLVEYGAQDVHYAQQGAYTGEISLPMLHELGCTWVLLGHSERRHIFDETDESISQKVCACLDSGIRPVLCFGETLDQRETKKTQEIVTRQITSVLSATENHPERKRLVFAYEPVWAIGTGRAATPGDAEEICGFAAGVLKQNVGYRELTIPFLYGGSVSPANAKELLLQEHISGLLVGGASLKPDAFLEIIDRAMEGNVESSR